MDLVAQLERLHALWFPADLDDAAVLGERIGVWFGGSKELDARLDAEHGGLPELVEASLPLDGMIEPRLQVAAVIALDQVPRNIHRGSPRAFAHDAAAVMLASAMVDAGLDEGLHPAEALFVYMPFEHAEDPTLQARSIACAQRLVERTPRHLRPHFEQCVEYAERHSTVIERFGRFPHRNEVLGRVSEPGEVAYLEGGGETFS